MAEEKKLNGPDFAQGVSLTEFTDGGMLQGHAKGESILVARRGERLLRYRRVLYTLRRPAGRRPCGGRYRPLPVAPRLFQSSHR